MARAIQVGLGRWGFSWSQDVIPRVPNVEMVAYVDTSPEATARVQTELGVDPKLCFSSLAEAAKAVKADLVIGTLRTEAHYPVVKEALELGFHVIVEKPFASTMAQAKELVALAQQHARILMVSQNYRFQQAPIAVSRLIGEQKFGPVNLVTVDFRRHGPSQGYKYWDFPDPLLADMSIHHFDLMRMVLNDNPKRVSCRTWNPPASPFKFHPVGVATLEFERGTIVSYKGSWMSGGTPTPWSGEWTMDCSDGEIFWVSRDNFLGTLGPDRVVTRERGGEAKPLELAPIEFTDRLGTLHAVAQAVDTGEFPPRFSSGADNLYSFAVVQATIASAAKNGEWIEIADIMK